VGATPGVKTMPGRNSPEIDGGGLKRAGDVAFSSPSDQRTDASSSMISPVAGPRLV
jgi:hypothetical protein